MMKYNCQHESSDFWDSNSISIDYLCYMRVRKTSFEIDLKEKEEAFLALTGEERIRMMRLVAERTRRPGVSYTWKGQKVNVKKPSEHL
jgi:hypothetical protein